MPTTNLGLPLITGNQTADVVRDMNALAEEIDLKAASGQTLATHRADDTSHVRYGADTGTANEKVVSLSPAPTSYVEGMAFAFKNLVANTGAVTVNVNGLGAVPLVKSSGNVLTSDNLKAGSIYTVRKGTTSFILQGEGASGSAVASDLLSGKTAGSDAGDIVGTMVNHTGVDSPVVSILGTSAGALYARPQAGFWSGSEASTVSEPNFIPSNIKQGVNMFGVDGTLVAGKASGTVTSSATTQSFQYANGGAFARGYVTVTGIPFKPSMVYLVYYDSVNFISYNSLYEEITGQSYPKTVKLASFNNTTFNVSTYHFKGDVAPANVVNGGFTLPVNNTNTVYKWLAIE